MSYFVHRTEGYYTVYEGRLDIPGTREVIGCRQTKRGARRLIRRHRRNRDLGCVYSELDYADLPDLRKSEYAP